MKTLKILTLLILLPTLFQGCSSCSEKTGSTDDLVRCEGSLVDASTTSASYQTDNNIFNFLDDPTSITEPKTIKVSVAGITSFKMHATEVTNSQYASFLREKSTVSSDTADGATNDCNLNDGAVALCYNFNGSGYTNSTLTGAGQSQIDSGYNVTGGYENRPVNYVSWYGALEYCKAKGKLLPTEIQFEAAATEGNSTTYPWGGATPDCTFANYQSATGTYCDSEPTTVATNTAGNTPTYAISDLAGNVSEWTLDAESTTSSFIVVKGGSWADLSTFLTVASEKLSLPETTNEYYGFRCVDAH